MSDMKDHVIFIADFTLAFKLVAALHKQGIINQVTYDNIIKKYYLAKI